MQQRRNRRVQWQMSQVPHRAVHRAVLRGASRVWHDLRFEDLHRSGKEFELMERAMGFAALAMLTVFPLLVVVAAASAATHHGVAEWVVYGMGLTCAYRKPMPPGDIHESHLRRGRAAGRGSGPGR